MPTLNYSKLNKIIIIEPPQNCWAKAYNIIALPFPETLDSSDCLHHDGVLIRDASLMFQDK